MREIITLIPQGWILEGFAQTLQHVHLHHIELSSSLILST